MCSKFSLIFVSSWHALLLMIKLIIAGFRSLAPSSISPSPLQVIFCAFSFYSWMKVKFQCGFLWVFVCSNDPTILLQIAWLKHWCFKTPSSPVEKTDGKCSRALSHIRLLKQSHCWDCDTTGTPADALQPVSSTSTVSFQAGWCIPSNTQTSQSGNWCSRSHKDSN